MGRKGGSGLSGGGVTPAQNKEIERIAKRTRDLKNEQYRIVDENGDVVLEKRGVRDQVSSTVGEKRQYMPGGVSIHNHPDGGTFSDADLTDFGYGARQIVAASPEGTYKLTNTKYGTRDQSRGWRDMRDAMDAAGVTKDRSAIAIRDEARKAPKVKKISDQMSKVSDKWVKAKQSGAPQSTLDKYTSQYNKLQSKYSSALKAQERVVETKPYHDFYRKNASKYGFKYEYVKR